MSLLNLIMGTGALLSGLALAAVCVVGCVVWIAGLGQHLGGHHR